jgi:hypothetical protein
MAQYSFPILENDELLPCMEEMELPITAAQLAKPTYDVVGPLFESVLISLTGITRCVRKLEQQQQQQQPTVLQRQRNTRTHISLASTPHRMVQYRLSSCF